MKTTVIYRPEWTCGRYNAKADTAIMYNLIAGQSYFFESYSAQVIREILSLPRNGSVELQTIAEHTGISIESICGFTEPLSEAGLICLKPYSRDEILAVRYAQAKNIITNNPQYDIQTNGQINISTAEQAYADSLNSNDGIASVMLELTYNCSEKCIHCYNAGATRNDCETGKRHRDEMGIEDYKRIIDELYNLGVYKVCLTGGDPFSKPIVWDIIDYLYKKDIAFDIFTNGQSITDKIDRLTDYYPRFIGLSVYSAIPEIHDKITRIKGSFHKTIAVAEQLSKYGIPMAFKCVVFKTNVKSYHTVKPLAKRYGAVLQIETNLCNGMDGDTSITNHLRLPKNVLEILLRDPDIPMYVGSERPLCGGEAKPSDACPCGAGTDNLNITPDGIVTPCCTFPFPLGNVKTQSLQDILQGEAIRQWRNTRVGDIEECGQHEKCNFCYLCAGNNYLEHGTWTKPSAVSCYMAEVRYDLSQKLKRGEDVLMGQTVTERLSRIDIEDVSSFTKEIKH